MSTMAQPMAQIAAPVAPQLAPLNPYGVIQYPYNPYGLQPVIAAPVGYPVAGGGYITIPGVQQPILQQPIYYNTPTVAQYNVRPQVAPQVGPAIAPMPSASYQTTSHPP